MAEAMRSRAFWILIVVLFLFSIGQNGAMTHLSALLTDRGVSASEAAIAVSLMGAASLLGRLVTGWLLDRFFAPRAVILRAGAGRALGIFLLSSAHSLAMGSLAAILIGGAMGGEADITPYLLSRYFGLRSFSMLYGFCWTAYAIAGAIGPVLMGRAFDTTRFVSGAGGEAVGDYVFCGGADAGDAGVQGVCGPVNGGGSFEVRAATRKSFSRKGAKAQRKSAPVAFRLRHTLRSLVSLSPRRLAWFEKRSSWQLPCFCLPSPRRR